MRKTIFILIVILVCFTISPQAQEKILITKHKNLNADTILDITFNNLAPKKYTEFLLIIEIGAYHNKCHWTRLKCRVNDVNSPKYEWNNMAEGSAVNTTEWQITEVYGTFITISHIRFSSKYEISAESGDFPSFIAHTGTIGDFGYAMGNLKADQPDGVQKIRIWSTAPIKAVLRLYGIEW